MTLDQLTRLPDRHGYVARIEALVRAGVGRLGLCHIDLDYFAELNDAYGVAAGDRLLAQVAQRLYQVGASGDHHLVARLDGDKFAILVENPLRPADVTALASRAVAALSEQPFYVDNRPVRLAASAGVVELPVDESTAAAEMVRAADTALHRAKADPRACVHTFDAGSRDAGRLTLARAMPAAIKDRQFTLHYQRLVDLTDGRLVGYEALARWEHPQGRLFPGAFLDIAQDTGLVVPLGEVLLRQACQQAAMWGGAAGGPYVSVNLAPEQLSDPGLLDSVDRALAESDLPADALQLEITEHAVLDTSDRAAGVLRELADRKVRVVLDDFGTGYSNLSVLQRLPLYGIKLDRSFIHDIDRPDRVTYSLLDAVVRLATALNLTVTAEGIEHEAQADAVRELGCHIGQGWLFGRPVPADTISRMTAGSPATGRLVHLGPGRRRGAWRAPAGSTAQLRRAG
jgi:diguanylate cyclase (GGDEF)-like protein